MFRATTDMTSRMLFGTNFSKMDFPDPPNMKNIQPNMKSGIDAPKFKKDWNANVDSWSTPILVMDAGAGGVEKTIKTFKPDGKLKMKAELKKIMPDGDADFLMTLIDAKKLNIDDIDKAVKGIDDIDGSGFNLNKLESLNTELDLNLKKLETETDPDVIKKTFSDNPLLLARKKQIKTRKANNVMDMVGTDYFPGKRLKSTEIKASESKFWTDYGNLELPNMKKMVDGKEVQMKMSDLGDTELEDMFNGLLRDIELDMPDGTIINKMLNGKYVAESIENIKKLDNVVINKYTLGAGVLIAGVLVGHFAGESGSKNFTDDDDEVHQKIQENTERLNCLGTCLVAGQDVNSDATTDYGVATTLNAEGHMTGNVIKDQYTESSDDLNINLSNLSPLELNALVPILLKKNVHVHDFYDAFIEASDTFTTTIAEFSEPTEKNIKDGLKSFNSSLIGDYVESVSKVKDKLGNTLDIDIKVKTILDKIKYSEKSLLNDNKNDFNSDFESHDKECALSIIAFKSATYTMNIRSTNVNINDEYFSGMCITSDDLNTHFDQSGETNCVNYCVSSNVCDIDMNSPESFVPDDVADDQEEEDEEEEEDEDEDSMANASEDIKKAITGNVDIGGTKFPIWVIILIVLLFIGGFVLASRKRQIEK